MQRRKMLAALGSVAVGGATAVSTGAFTSVEADRTVSIQTAGDAGAFLSITRATENGEATPNAEQYVDGDLGQGTVELDFTESDDGASGINKDAKTIFDNLLDVKNQGTQEVEVFVESSLVDGGGLGVYSENELGTANDNTGFSNNDPVTLGAGATVDNIGVFVTKSGSSNLDVEDGTLTFVAERTGGNRD